MNDFELISMAAKAAGFKDFMYTPIYTGTGSLMLVGKSMALIPWRPFDDDGDALRLAVQLKLDICFYQGFQEVCIQGEGTPDTPDCIGEILEINEPFGDDIPAATRRAIVRAAAEIGRKMP